MKYLKPFYESTNEFYQEITQGEYLSNAFTLEESPLTDNDIWSLENAVDDLNSKKKKGWSDIYLRRDSDSGCYLKYKYLKVLQISKFDDEWFYVINTRFMGKKEYYKCDQIEGLLKLLNELELL